MKVFIAVATSETQHVGAINSCFELTRRDGDMLYIEWKSRGDVAREALLDEFLKQKEFGAILMLDGDQRHPKDMLEKLRAHDLDLVCAHYYRRETHPIQSLCYEIGDGKFPYLPYLHPPKDGLHEIAVTGFGCVLIKRCVIEAVQQALPKGMNPFAIGTLPEVANDHQNWGSDFRFFILARRLGYQLYLDASIESLHATTIWLGHKSAERLVNYTDWADACSGLIEQRLELHGMSPEAFKQRKRILEARKLGLKQQYDVIDQTDPQQRDALVQTSANLWIMEGKILEMNAWIEWTEKYPAIERPDQLPTTQNTPPMVNVERPDQPRLDMYREQAMSMIQELPKAGGDGAGH